MKCGNFFIITTLAFLLGFASVALAAPAMNAPAVETTAEPTAASSVVKNFYTQLADTMKQGEQLGYSGRFKKLQPTVKVAFDMPYMTRVAVGTVWSQATPDEQQQLIAAFSDFSVANYAHNFAKYNGEQFTVVDEKPIKDGAIVETTIKPKDKDPVALNYLMHKDDQGNWSIVDIYLNGSISELATRRSEFSSIATHDGIPALVNSLGEKSKSMGPS
jgi:phospholipid transport system substrate-binding protein